jgi:hypothetical protein
MAQKNFRASPDRDSGDGRPRLTAGPAQQLGGVCFQHLAPDLAAKILAIPVRFDQPGPHQLLDMMRDRCLGHRKLFPQLATGAFLLAGDDLEYRHAPRIGQRLGDQLELLLGQ